MFLISCTVGEWGEGAFAMLTCPFLEYHKLMGIYPLYKKCCAILRPAGPLRACCKRTIQAIDSTVFLCVGCRSRQSIWNLIALYTNHNCFLFGSSI